tara:strand:- start:16199 stop:17098 length:900 start_codon:yes stop_codon:yes gene_type:complete
MKVAVFGGGGFLGKYLVKELLARNYEVTILDKAQNWDFLSANIEFLKTDIMDRDLVKSQIKKGQFDFIYNLAGFANLEQATESPYLTMQLNIIGNINILDACITENIKRFIYASSAYAMSNKGSFYGISKLSSEKITEEYQNKYNLSFTILRYGSVYSEDDFDNNYIYKTVEKAIKSGLIEHGGDGNEMREYIHASDAAKLSVDVIEDEKFVNDHVILTGAEKMKRMDLFQMINEIHGNDIVIKMNVGEYKNHYNYTPYSHTPTLSKKLISNPHIDMGQGILECIKAVYRNHKELEESR